MVARLACRPRLREPYRGTAIAPEPDAPAGVTPVLHRKLVKTFILSFLAGGLLFVAPASSDAQAQRRPIVRRPHPRVVVVPRHVYRPYWSWSWFHYGYGYPYRYGGYWGPWGYPSPYGYGYGYRDDTSAVRLEVTPRDARVFVDGYDAGIVDEFDGVFQRLRLEPGGHEIVLYLDGYRTVRRELYLRPGSDHRVKLNMEPLGSGESMDAPPTPAERSDDGEAAPSRFPVEPRQGPREPAQRAEPRARFGVLSIRVQPADAQILIDGEPWATTNGQNRLTVELAEGRHRVEIRKPGFSDYQEEVLIRRDATLTLNVSLK
jgi:hypothetical protein